MNLESQEVIKLFGNLCSRPKQSFPRHRKSPDAPAMQGVYIIRDRNTVLHVGRTFCGKNGIHQRLKNHLHSASSFTKKYLKGSGATLRKDGYTYQYLELEDPRKRALLEAYAVGTLCPAHLGLGKK